MLEEQEGMGLIETYQFAVSVDGINLVDADTTTVKGKTGDVYIAHCEGGWSGSNCRGN
jgi:hypothetical protein